MRSAAQQGVVTLWIDSEVAEQAIGKIENEAVRSAVQQIRSSGFTILPGVLRDEDCNGALADYDRFCRENRAHADEFKLDTGFHSRLYNLHMTSQSVRNVALNPTILEVLDHVFPARCALNSTLFFEQGSQQEIHRDTPFFTAKPFEGEFVGVWYALEDVHDEAGPLLYVEKGHLLPVDRYRTRDRGELDVGKLFLDYCDQVKELCANSGLVTKRLLLKKGDAAIWHAELPHGGSPIARALSRRSVVAHYIPEGAYIQDVGYFFGLQQEQQIMEFTDAGNGRLMRWCEPPVFMPNA